MSRRAALGVVALSALALAGCSGSSSKKPSGSSSSGAGAGPDAAASTFAVNPPSVYVAKVKNLLVALPPTDDEVKAVEADPNALGGLIDGWMKLPEYTGKMTEFFELAFQQTQISITDLSDQAYPRQAAVNSSVRNLLVQNVRESFARTMLELIGEGHPFTEAMTTNRYMMTPALMELYAFLDAWQVGDDGKATDRFKASNPNVQLTIEAAQGPIPIADTLNPSSPNYMHWYDPDVGDATKLAADCLQDPIVYPSRGDVLHYLIFGSLIQFNNSAGKACLQYGGSAAAPQLTDTDFNTWKMVSVRAPNTGEAATAFYDLPTMRTGDELVLQVPRLGFFTTPAFFANWQTNISNQMRVTINQSLIVALGAAVDGTDTTIPPSTPGLDATHAANPSCTECHRTLDPTRSILAATYSWNYHNQVEAAFSGQPGLFAFQGVTKPVTSVADLGATFASHPRFSIAWAQKLCYYANSSACDEKDPEFQRVVSVFQKSNYSWSALVHEVFSSPLATNATPTRTTLESGGVVAVARRDHLCAALNARLGFTDICVLDASTKVTGSQTIPQIAAGLPSDGYGRGAVAPVLPNEPTLFYRAGVENICEAVAGRVIDPKTPTPNAKQWTGTDPDTAIGDFVGIVMGLTASDPRAASAKTILRSHFDAAVQSKESASNALRSTFIVACLSPSAVAIGM